MVSLPSADVSHTTFNILTRYIPDMDSERSIAARSAGQVTRSSGSRFFTAMARTFKPTNGQNSLSNSHANASEGPRESGSGLRPYHRLADGDGR